MSTKMNQSNKWLELLSYEIFWWANSQTPFRRKQWKEIILIFLDCFLLWLSSCSTIYASADAH